MDIKIPFVHGLDTRLAKEKIMEVIDRVKVHRRADTVAFGQHLAVLAAGVLDPEGPRLTRGLASAGAQEDPLVARSRLLAQDELGAVEFSRQDACDAAATAGRGLRDE